LRRKVVKNGLTFGIFFVLMSFHLLTIFLSIPMSLKLANLPEKEMKLQGLTVLKSTFRHRYTDEVTQPSDNLVSWTKILFLGAQRLPGPKKTLIALKPLPYCPEVRPPVQL
jgi:hypothetical protein